MRSAPFILTLLVSLDAHAQDDAWRLYAEALTEAPLQVGARLVAEAPNRIRFGTSVGYLPGPYVDLINGLLVATDVYSEQTADIIEIALKDSLLWKTHVGWRPVADLGSYVEVSYTLMGLGGGVSGEDALVAGAELTPPTGGQAASYEIGSATHLLGVEAGYVFEFDSGLTLRAGMGMSITLDADFSIAAKGGVLGREQIEGGSKDYLDSVFERWVHPPYFAFAAGYRLF